VCAGCSSLDFVPVCGRVCGGGKRQCAAEGRAKNVTQKNNGREGGGWIMKTACAKAQAVK